jgi:hypothetical protein
VILAGFKVSYTTHATLAFGSERLRIAEVSHTRILHTLRTYPPGSEQAFL